MHRRSVAENHWNNKHSIFKGLNTSALAAAGSGGLKPSSWLKQWVLVTVRAPLTWNLRTTLYHNAWKNSRTNKATLPIKTIVFSFVRVYQSLPKWTHYWWLHNASPTRPAEHVQTRWQISANCSKTMWTADDRRSGRAAETAVSRWFFFSFSFPSRRLLHCAPTSSEQGATGSHYSVL